jgi:two-component system, cell cycle sensor histidine kinase and response regulator CckA
VTEGEDPVPPKTVLVADDDAQFRENIAGLLEAKGFTVHPACDGVDALLAVRANHPDIVVLAVLLPKIDGGRVCRLIRQDRRVRHTPVVALSPLSLEDTKRFPELNADAFVAKRAWKDTGQDILEAIEYLGKGEIGLGSGIFGFHRFRALKLPPDLFLSRRHYETLLRGLPCGVLELDAHGRILMANARAADLLQAREANLIGDLLQGHLPENDRDAFDEAIRIAVKSTASEDHRVPVSLGSPALSLNLLANVDGGRCLGFLVTME